MRNKFLKIVIPLDPFNEYKIRMSERVDIF